MGGSITLQAKKDGHIAYLVFNPFDESSIFTTDFLPGLKEVVAKVDEDPSIRVIVIKSEGEGLAAHRNLDEASFPFEGHMDDSQERVYQIIMELQKSMSVTEKNSKPIIWAVFNYGNGGAIDLLSGRNWLR